MYCVWSIPSLLMHVMFFKFPNISDFVSVLKNRFGILGKGKAGELGGRRMGTVEFLKYGLCPNTFFAFTFYSLRRLALETISSPFPVLGNSVLMKRNKCIFECYYGSNAFAISKLRFP